MHSEINSELRELLRRLLEEPYLLHERLTLESLIRAAEEGRLVVRRKGGVIIACSFLWVVSDDDWFELGTIWVKKQFRGDGLHTEVFRECIERRKGRSLFLITAHEGIKTMVTEFGWTEEEKDWTKVPLWKRIADPWDDRYPPDSNIKHPGKLFYNFFRP